MKTKAEIINELKSQFPTLKKGSEENGYEILSDEEYEKIILEWADAELAKLTAEAELEAKEAKRIAALAKLGALGLDEDDLKALGL